MLIVAIELSNVQAQILQQWAKGQLSIEMDFKKMSDKVTEVTVTGLRPNLDQALAAITNVFLGIPPASTEGILDPARGNKMFGKVRNGHVVARLINEDVFCGAINYWSTERWYMTMPLWITGMRKVQYLLRLAQNLSMDRLLTAAYARHIQGHPLMKAHERQLSLSLAAISASLTADEQRDLRMVKDILAIIKPVLPQ